MISMDPNITIDISAISNILGGLSSTAISKLTNMLLTEVSNALVYNWREEADGALSSTRNLYKNGIQRPEINATTAVIELIGRLANMIESGAPAFDMKPGFQNSPKVKQKKNGNGWYLTIPFRQAAATSLGENEAFSNVMPKQVYNVAMDLKSTVSKPNGTIIYGGSLSKDSLPKKFQKPSTREAITDNDNGKVLYGAYQHKNSIYEGIIKTSKLYEKSSQSQYFSFRRVSNTSDPLSWIHPGFIAANLSDKAVDSTDVDTIVDNVANSFAESMGL